jgi:hypothetical protein
MKKRERISFLATCAGSVLIVLGIILAEAGLLVSVAALLVGIIALTVGITLGMTIQPKSYKIKIKNGEWWRFDLLLGTLHDMRSEVFRRVDRCEHNTGWFRVRECLSYHIEIMEFRIKKFKEACVMEPTTEKESPEDRERKTINK